MGRYNSNIITIITINIAYGMKALEYYYYAWKYLQHTQYLGDMLIPKSQWQQYDYIKLDLGT
jgi:hypothetical protein